VNHWYFFKVKPPNQHHAQRLSKKEMEMSKSHVIYFENLHVRVMGRLST
jgi:hypothetical protein